MSRCSGSPRGSAGVQARQPRRSVSCRAERLDHHADWLRPALASARTRTARRRRSQPRHVQLRATCIRKLMLVPPSLVSSSVLRRHCPPRTVRAATWGRAVGADRQTDNAEHLAADSEVAHERSKCRPATATPSPSPAWGRGPRPACRVCIGTQSAWEKRSTNLSGLQTNYRPARCNPHQPKHLPVGSASWLPSLRTLDWPIATALVATPQSPAKEGSLIRTSGPHGGAVRLLDACPWRV